MRQKKNDGTKIQHAEVLISHASKKKPSVTSISLKSKKVRKITIENKIDVMRLA